MKVYIRTDASVEIGTGHVMRCIVLAEQLRKRKVEVTFICRPLIGNLISFIKEKGFPVKVLLEYKDANRNLINWMKENWKLDAKETADKITEQMNDAHWLIIDHYGIDAKWEKLLKQNVKRIMVIDDLANRNHDCDLLLDQNLYRNMLTRYNGLVPAKTKQLLGTKYVLLRDEFLPYINFKRNIHEVKKILISFGGSDPTNETLKVLKAMESLNLTDLQIDVIIGYSNPHRNIILDYCQHLPYVQVHINAQHISKLMKEAHIAIGSGGSSTWERIFMCLPTLTIETALNQREILRYLSEIGVIYHLGKSEKVDESHITIGILELITNKNKLKQMIDSLTKLKEQFEVNAVSEELISLS